jgi:hypothetical protein
VVKQKSIDVSGQLTVSISTFEQREKQSRKNHILLVTFFLLLFHLKVETVRSFETSIAFYQTTRRYNPEKSRRQSDLVAYMLFCSTLKMETVLLKETTIPFILSQCFCFAEHVLREEKKK